MPKKKKESNIEEDSPKHSRTKENNIDEGEVKGIKLDKKELVESAGSQASAALLKAAEAESLATEESLDERKKKLLAKVKALSGKVDVTKTEELKEQVKEKKKADMLLPLEDYVKSGIYLGTRVVTPGMRQYVYRRRADGLAILNTDTIDEKLKTGIEYLSKFAPQDVIVVCKRQAGWKAVEMFSKITGIRAFMKKYPAGILTNTTLPNFFETELAIIADSWLDKNALLDMLRIKKNVLMLSDTNNMYTGANEIIIGNNKSDKSLGLVFYLLARGYCKAREIEADIPNLEFWTGEK